jgi:hypothetical protein
MFFHSHTKVIGTIRATAVGLVFRRVLKGLLTPCKMDCSLELIYMDALITMPSLSTLMYLNLHFLRSNC